MGIEKIKSEALIESFQKLGESHRSLKGFLKENRGHLPKQVLKALEAMLKRLESNQQEMIDLAFDEVFRKKGKKT